jgi:ADP-ribose pyrophosphatase YjhB (NUDIX family)
VYVFRFCPDCGARLSEPESPPARLSAQVCDACRAIHYRNAKPCAGALVVRDGQVLLGKRAIEPGRGLWDIPGGFLEPWEHPADGAAREVLEETGLTVRMTSLLTVIMDTYYDQFYTLNVYYLAEILHGVQQAADDLAELRWFAPAALPTEFAFPHCKQVIDTWISTLQYSVRKSRALSEQCHPEPPERSRMGKDP